MRDAGSGLRGQRCASARRGRGGLGRDDAPRSPLLPAALSTLGGAGIPAGLPFIAARRHQTPRRRAPAPDASTTGESRAWRRAGGEHCLDKDSTRIQ